MDTFNETNGFEEEPLNNQPQEPVSEEPEAAAIADQEPAAGPSEEAETEQTHDASAAPQSQEYRGAGVGQKESPFANSPYYTSWQPQNGQTERSTYEPKQSTYEPQHTAPEKKPAAKKTGKKAWKPVVAASLTVALIAGSCGITAAAVNNHWEKKTDALEDDLTVRINALQDQLDNQSVQILDAVNTAEDGNSSGSIIISGTSIGMTPSRVYSQNVNAVVAIANQTVTTNIYGQTSETASSGSGFIISEDGYVVTNYHVVEGATTLTVITYDSTEYEAKLIGYDESNDVALLKVDATDLPSVTIGSSDDLNVGDQVVAIGNPLGELTSSLSAGYVSAKDRTINTDGSYINMIQIDAAINAGNSGGPLFNMMGEVVGITTAKYSGSTSSGASIEGIGFAIPMDDVISIVSDLKEYGYVTGAYLGVSVTTVSDVLVARYGLPQGSYVESVVTGNCAQIAGVQQKDIIVAIGDYEVTSNTDLTKALRQFDPGDTTTITVYRSGQYLDLTITLDEKPAPTTEDTTTTDPSNSSELPSDGSYEEWYNYFAPYFGGGGR